MSLKVIRLDPAYSWYFLRKDVEDSIARAQEMLNLAVWSAEWDLEHTIA